MIRAMIRSTGPVCALVLAAISGSALAQQASHPTRDNRDLNNRQNSPWYNGGPSSRSFPGSIPGGGNFAGIGQGRANIDMLSHPARRQVFATPQPFPLVDVPAVVTAPTAADAFVLRRRHHHQLDTSPIFLDNDRRFFEDSAFFVSGDWRSRHWGVRFNLGGDPVFVSRLGAPAVSYDPYYGGYVYGYGNPYYPPAAYGYPFGPYAVAPGYPTQMVGPSYEDASPQQARPQPPAAQQPPASDLDVALTELRAGQVDSAVKDLRRHLKAHPDDPRAMRIMAVALLEGKHFDDGAAMLRQAYRTDPGLSGEPIDTDELGLDDTELRRMVTSTVLYAHRTNTGSSWLMVAALMQAEGRTVQARDMLARAEKLGLEAAVAAPMKAALQP